MKNKILMCRPDYFDVKYVINPWMEGNISRAKADISKKQWEDLYSIISSLAKVSLVEPKKEVPDLVFTANAGLVFDSTCIISKFFHKERSLEEPIFSEWFESNGFSCKLLPEDIPFEGAGDALFDRAQNILWAGYGFRTELESHSYLSEWVPSEVLSLRLIDSRFYHLDTCFCPLENGYLMYFPPAFDEYSNKLIEKRIPKEKRIIVPEKDAILFACNAVNIENHIIMNKVSESLTKTLNNLGFKTHLTPLGEYLKAGGAAKCLTLKLNEPIKTSSTTKASVESELIEFSGHIIDTGTLGSALDCIVNGGGSFHVQNFQLGQQRQSISTAVLKILAPTKKIIDQIIPQLIKLGGTLVQNENKEASFSEVLIDGVAPDDFYISSIFSTEIFIKNNWLKVQNQKTNNTIVVKNLNSTWPEVLCKSTLDLKKGDLVITGSKGIRTIHKAKAREPRHINDYSFMVSNTSSQKRIDLVIEHIAWDLKQIKNRCGKITICAGQVVVHTGASEYLSYMIREGFVSALLCNNGMALHDIELAIMGTSHGVDINQGLSLLNGHQNNLRALNQIYKCGSIADSVSKGILNSGIMYECVKNKVPYSISASLRDHLLLPDTEKNIKTAQSSFSDLLHGSDIVIVLSSIHDGEALSNMTPAGVKLIIVDMDIEATSKIKSVRGTDEVTEIITDVGLFLSLLSQKLKD